MKYFYDWSKFVEKEYETLVNMAVKANSCAFSICEHNLNTLTKTGQQLYQQTKELRDSRQDFLKKLDPISF